MCGRYKVTREFSEIKLAFDATALDLDFKLDFSGNISASYSDTSQAPLILRGSSERTFSTGRFWYIPPFWQRPLKSLPTSFNARSERVLDSLFWREAMDARRCLVPALSWFERDEKKTSDYQFSPASTEHRVPGSPLFALAGLWADSQSDDGSPVRSFAIVTRAADRQALAVHPRMPLIIPPDLYDDWLGGTDAAGLLSTTLDRTREIPLTIAKRPASAARSRAALPKAQLDLFGRAPKQK